MAGLKSVSIVVPAYNAAKSISGVIEALLQQDYPQDKLEIIIIDDGSTDSTAEIVKQYPVRYINQENKGPAAARNLGWRLSNNEIICFTDSDCLAEKMWVTKMVTRYTSEHVAGVGGSYDIVNPQNLLASCIHEEIIQRHLQMSGEVNYLGAFNVSYRRSVLEEVDGFDESYRIASGEDNDIAYRIKKIGYHLIFDKDIGVAHHHPTNLFKYLKRQFRHGYWRMKIYHEHSDMAGGDMYAGLMDLARPPLALATLVLLPFSFYFPVIYIVLTLLVAILALQLPLALGIIKRTRQKKFFALIPISFVREYARGLGMALGVFRFFVFEALRDWRTSGRA